MYESEIYLKKQKETLPKEMVKEFLCSQDEIQSISVLHWSEHCTECAMPECYKTCNLYEPRIDGKCKRFTIGMKRISLGKGKNILKIGMKKWGSLGTQANCVVYKKKDAYYREQFDIFFASIIYFGLKLIPNSSFKRKLLKVRYAMKKKYLYTHQISTNMEHPDGFLVEIFNPNKKKIPIELSMRNGDENLGRIPFQHKIDLKHGYNKEFIPFKEIEKSIKIDAHFRISLTPSNNKEDDFLYFGILDFVKLKKVESEIKKATKIKCVVWDLDNTVWDGILIENGIKNLKLKRQLKEILQTIENKGIINSIATKNNEKEAIEALNHFGLKDFFLYPQISWEPKSISLQNIANELNINLNSILFIDDSDFERSEVSSVLPQVKVIDALEYLNTLDMKELDVPITEESKKRKEFYLNEVNRKKESKDFGGKYFDFLKKCEIKLKLQTLQPSNFERVYELTQRTNQMNFSGNRYQKTDLEKIYKDQDLDTYVMDCSDTYGEYGIVGFGVVKKSENRLVDLMFSCRIQSKRVEHAFITYCLSKYLIKGDFNVTYKHTERNKFSARVFDDFGFEQIEQNDEKRLLRFKQGVTFLNDNLINIKEI